MKAAVSLPMPRDFRVLAEKFRLSLPKPLWQVFRKVANAFLAPLHFSLETGHLRSALLSRAMDRHGEPLPWYTYSAIQFLLYKDYSQRRILEWGAGQSTLFWSKHAKDVVSFESDPRWYEHLKSRTAGNVALHLVDDDLSGAERFVKDRKFDIIVVDGMDRPKCAQRSLNLLTPDGAIILDDAERFCSYKADFGTIALYREAGFSRFDFYGYSPGNCTQHCTSIFFKDHCFLISGADNPRVSLSAWEIA